MNKELERYYGNLRIIESVKESLKISRAAFEETLINELNTIKVAEEENIELKKTIQDEALNEYESTGEKKLTGGLGIRITTKLDYDEVAAINWAKINMPIAIKEIIDKKQFETFAKTNELDFVEKIESVGVTFPKEFKGELK